MKFFENLKRLLEPRARPPVQIIGESTADRPPPTPAEPFRELASPETIPAVYDVSEVRSLLEAVAEAPVSTTEPEAEVPVQAPEPATTPPEPTPAFPPTPNQHTVDVASAAPAVVGDALVLTLATPAATFTVAKAAATIGRGQENTIRLDDLSVSRRHARIAYKQGGYWLSDTGSMGGTWVDGTRLNAPYRIAPGQIIDIGLCRLTVSFATGAASADKKETTRKPRSEIAEQGRRRR